MAEVRNEPRFCAVASRPVTRFHRNVNIAAVILPFVAFLAAIPMLWNELVGWTDLALFALMYGVSTMGITVGFHRLLTHRAFQTS